jgi:cyclase
MDERAVILSPAGGTAGGPIPHRTATRPLEADEVAPGIVTLDHSVAEGKNGIVFGSRRTLVIDTGTHAHEGEALAAAIRERGRTPDLVALTHGHGDHVRGGGVFRGAEVFAHALTEGLVRTELPRWSAQTGLPPAEMAAALPWPTVTFTDSVRIDLGGKHARLFHTPGHSPDSSCAYVEEDRVLFGGDTAVTGIVPAFANGSSRTLQTTLHALAAMDVEVLVPGHGPVLHGAARVRDWLLWLAGYLAAARRAVQRGLAAGRSHDAIADSAGFDEHVADRLPRDKHGMVQRHRTTVERLLAEETG